MAVKESFRERQESELEVIEVNIFTNYFYKVNN